MNEAICLVWTIYCSYIYFSNILKDPLLICVKTGYKKMIHNEMTLGWVSSAGHKKPADVKRNVDIQQNHIYEMCELKVNEMSLYYNEIY